MTPDYFRTLQIPLLAGRTFTEADDEDAPRVGIIDERLAKRIFGDANPIGRRFHPPMPARVMPDAGWYTIVGVVGHIRHDRLDEDGRPQVYWNYKQLAQDRHGAGRADAGRSGRRSRRRSPRAIRSIDPEQPVYDARTLDAVVDRSLAQRWLQTTILGRVRDHRARAREHRRLRRDCLRGRPATTRVRHPSRARREPRARSWRS